MPKATQVTKDNPRAKKDPTKTDFNPEVHKMSQSEFKRFFEANFTGDWQKYYKGKTK